MAEIQKTTFDYNALEKSQSAHLRSAATAIKAAISRTQNDILEIGRRLRDVRDTLENTDFAAGEHVSFRAWIAAEFGMSRSAAYRLIGIANAFESCSNLGQLSIEKSALYELAAPSTPEEAREFAVEYAETGETVTHAVAKEIIAAHKPSEEAASTPESAPDEEATSEDADNFDESENDDEAETGDSQTQTDTQSPASTRGNSAGKSTSSTSSEPPLTVAQKIEAMPLYQALMLHGHIGRIFFDQAEEWFAAEKVVRGAHARLIHTRYMTGAFTDALRALGSIPEPSLWEGCASCKGTTRVGERADPCPRCKGGFTVHAGQGVSADVVATTASLAE